MSQLTFGSYRVVLELGAGSVSTVYRAEHEKLGRVVALKALKSTIAPTSAFAAQLEREARLLGELSHPNIVLLHDFVKTDTQMYLVLEHVDGFSLAAVLAGLTAKKATLTPDAVAHIGAEVARALSHAHDRGIVHRDVKPANILLAKTGEVKLVDFGIAQRDRLATADEPFNEERKLTPNATPSEGFGTPAYMSPEQILGEFVDARSDVFSLGVVMYELLCGVRPFDKDDKTNDALHRVRRDPPTPLRVRAPDVPRALERVIMRCLAKLPGDRFTSAHAVADALDDFVRARIRGPRKSLVTRALVKAQLIEDTFDQSIAAVLEERRAPIRPAILGFAVLSLLLVLGGLAIQLTRGGAQKEIASGGAPLELVPQKMGFLRVVVTPWAEVFVDGQRIDFTPFAKPIPLGPGVHYVTLLHPQAAAEKRSVKIIPNETVALDVTMNVTGSAVEDAGSEPEGDAVRIDAGRPTARGDQP